MQEMSAHDSQPVEAGGAPANVAAIRDHPVREYISALAGELAQMARVDGAPELAAVLEVAATLAQRPD